MTSIIFISFFSFIQSQNIPLVDKAISGKLTKDDYKRHFKMSDHMLSFNSIKSVKLIDRVDDYYVLKFSFSAKPVDIDFESLEILDKNGTHISSNSFSNKSGHEYAHELEDYDYDDLVEAKYFKGGFIRTKSHSINDDGIERDYYVSVIDSNYHLMDIEIDTTYLDADKYKSFENKTIAELRLLRNEIFARNGHSFSDPLLKQFFKNQKWYEDSGRMKIKTYMLTKKERSLVNAIYAMEKKAKSVSKSVVYRFENNKIFQELTIYGNSKSDLNFKLISQNKENSVESILTGTAKLKDGIEIDEDEEGLAYPANEYIYDNKCWLTIRIASEDQSKIQINSSCNSVEKSQAPFKSAGILKRIEND